VASPDEIIADPQVAANGYLSVVKGRGEDVRVVSSPVVFDDEPLGDLRAMSEFGEDTETILLESGYTWSEITEAKRKGVII
jgi:crotonobetainyl-CoA:carnitine CoA-transferase CaiB-like acyl-CoA transferase